MIKVRLRRVVEILVALTAMLLLGGAFHAHGQALPDQPIIPMGRFEICAVDQQEVPVPGVDFSIKTDADGDVITGFTADDGCRSGDIIAGPAHFEMGTGIIHDAIIHDKETVKEVFTVPPYELRMPELAR